MFHSHTQRFANYLTQRDENMEYYVVNEKAKVESFLFKLGHDTDTAKDEAFAFGEYYFGAQLFVVMVTTEYEKLGKRKVHQLLVYLNEKNQNIIDGKLTLLDTEVPGSYLLKFEYIYRFTPELKIKADFIYDKGQLGMNVIVEAINEIYELLAVS